MNKDQFNHLSKIILDAAISVHKEMGPGLLESVYQQCLVKEFKLRNVLVEVMVQVPFGLQRSHFK